MGPIARRYHNNQSNYHDQLRQYMDPSVGGRKWSLNLMNFEVGDLITHSCGYKAIVLQLGENIARICVFYHPEWGEGRLENWLFDDRVHGTGAWDTEITEVQSGV